MLLWFLIGFQTTILKADSTDVIIQSILSEKNDDARIGKLFEYVIEFQESDANLNLLFTQKLLQLAQKQKDKFSEAFAYSQLGYHAMTIGNRDKSLEYVLKSLKMTEELNSSLLLAIVNNRLGHDYITDLNKRKTLYKTAFMESLKTNCFPIQYITCTNIGSVFLRMNILDSALIYLQRAEQISTKAKKFPFLGGMYSELGSVYGKLKNQMIAIAYFNLAIKEMSQFNSPRFLGQIYTNIATYYSDQGQIDSCTHYARKAIEVVENTPFQIQSRTTAKLLMNIYRNKDNNLAMKYAEMYIIANDSINDLRRIQQSQLLTFEEEMRQQDLAAKKSEEEQQRKQNIQYALIALGIVTFLILFFLLSRSIIVTEKWISFFGILGLLIVFEFINLLMHPFLEHVTHHSPLLMLMALVALASLLIPLHHRTEKWIKDKMTEKNKRIRLENAKKTIEQLERETNSKNG
jgi:tetratricopeptide (TPR) repeat protein